MDNTTINLYFSATMLKLVFLDRDSYPRWKEPGFMCLQTHKTNLWWNFHRQISHILLAILSVTSNPTVSSCSIIHLYIWRMYISSTSPPSEIHQDLYIHIWSYCSYCWFSVDCFTVVVPNQLQNSWCEVKLHILIIYLVHCSSEPSVCTLF